MKISINMRFMIGLIGLSSLLLSFRLMNNGQEATHSFLYDMQYVLDSNEVDNRKKSLMILAVGSNASLFRGYNNFV